MIKPLGSKVIVEQDEKPTQTKTGLYVTGNLEGSIRRGTVRAKGDKALDVEVGDRIIFQSFTGNPCTIEGEQYLVMYESEIIGTIDESND